MLAKRYRTDLAKFARFVIMLLGDEVSSSTSQQASSNAPKFDVIVVGGGLAGLTSAITVADRGGRVLLVEKNPSTGGNSAYASSGINAVDPAIEQDSIEAYRSDMEDPPHPLLADTL